MASCLHSTPFCCCHAIVPDWMCDRYARLCCLQDPLTAAKLGAPADYDLYWNNKLKKPLVEILTTCLTQGPAPGAHLPVP